MTKKYDRGSKDSYQKWADMVGDDSYTFENILPFFKRSAHFTAPNNAAVRYDPNAFSLDGGPLDVSYSNYALPITPGVEAGLQELGMKSIPGLNSGDLIGYAHSCNCLNPRSQIRSSSESSFLQMALMNTTLRIYQQTTAEKIQFDMNRAADAVTVTSFGVSFTLKATKEVILSAGAVSLELPSLFASLLTKNSLNHPKCSSSQASVLGLHLNDTAFP